MSKVILPSCPNWFLSNCICIAKDGYIVYGTLSVGIGILVPQECKYSFCDFKVIRPAHKDRVNCLDLCPDWLETRSFVSGADDGYVKLWRADTLTFNIAHNCHENNKETVAAVAFLDSKYVVSVGSDGYVVLWNIKSNTVIYNLRSLKGFKPSCLSLCPYKKNVIAVGTKQGVVVVLKVQVAEKVSICYKAPGHDAEITSVSWCPIPDCDHLDNIKFNIHSNKMNKSKTKSKQHTSSKEDVKTENKIESKIIVEPKDCLNVNEKNNIKLKTEIEPENEEKIIEDINVNSVSSISKDESNDFLQECNAVMELIKSKGKNDKKKDEICENVENETVTLPTETESNKKENDESDYEISSEELFNNSEVVDDDDDLFDIYKDHSFDEFGHSKNKPETIDTLNVENDSVVVNGVSRKIIHSKRILKKSESNEEKIVEKLVNNLSTLKLEAEKKDFDQNVKKENCYLASSCKKGILCIWRWGGALVLCENIKIPSKAKYKKNIAHPYGATLWLHPDRILACAKGSELVDCHFTDIMNIKKMHDAHKRGLYAIASNSVDNNGIIWTASMDRLLAAYLPDNTTILYSTFGGFVYDIKLSPIDVDAYAVGCGDGVIRLFEMSKKDDVFQPPSLLHQFWNGINGKVLSIAWHPTQENCLAFSTIEGRIGLLNTFKESPPKLLPFALPLGVFHICWSGSVLFACGGGSLVAYDTTQHVIEAKTVHVKAKSEHWKVSTMHCTEEFLVIGSPQGGIALLERLEPFEVKHTAYPHRNAITAIEWHPPAVTSENNKSPYANLVAVCAKATNIVIMQLVKTDDGVMLNTYRDFKPHSERVTNIAWSPHRSGILLSTSHDWTAQVYDVVQDCLIASFIDHQDSVLCATWLNTDPDYVLSGGEDCSVRLWCINDYPPMQKLKTKTKQKTKMTLAKLPDDPSNTDILKSDPKTNEIPEESINLAVISKPVKKSERKIIPLTVTWKEYQRSGVEGCRRLFRKIQLTKEGTEKPQLDTEDGYSYLKLFSDNEDVLDMLNAEQNNHKERFYWDAWIITGILKGDLKGVLEQAANFGMLNSTLLALAPSVSHRFWKDMLLNYCSKSNENKISKSNDMISLDTLGNVWLAMLQFVAGQVEEGCSLLVTAHLELEAIAAARVRHADHIAEKHLRLFIKRYVSDGQYRKAAECYLSLGDVKEAAIILGKSNDELDLALAAEMAKFEGNVALADSYLKPI